MIVIFSDLDGTLLEERTYSADEAGPALKCLKERHIPVVFCTSKTRAEVEVWRRKLDNDAPFIVENGGALFVPTDFFPLPILSPTRREEYIVIEFGDPYVELVETLSSASSESGCRVLGFHDMSIAEVSDRCGLPPWMAALAKQREYDEPFEILGGNREGLLEGIISRKKRWTRGGRFYHVTGANDKAHAVRLLTHYFQRQDLTVTTVGIGDGLNDAGFLRAVDIPVLLPSSQTEALRQAVPRARVAKESGPAGWNSAVLRLLGDCASLAISGDEAPG
jgi:mannosyl-3-phosphoglycerate phosphatase